jgi:hypothetical protein
MTRILPRIAPNYVQREVLANIPDVFDPEALWQAPGLALFSRRPLLRDLLERSPREQRGRAATRCFSHVTLILPQEEVDDDRHLTRGARVRDLTQGLAALHQKDFGDLLGGEEVRYQVAGSESLEPGAVEVRFGHAVYLPAPGETIQYTVAVSRDSAVWKTVCPIYPNQRLTLIGHDEHAATYAAPGWPFGADGAILLVNDGPGSQLEVQVRPKDAFDCVYDAAQGYYMIRSRRAGVDAAGAPLRLLLRVSPVTPAARKQAAAPQAKAETPRPLPVPPAAATAVSARPAVWKPRLATIDEGTALPAARQAAQPTAVQPPELDATYAPVARQRVALAALALPRLSRYRETGAPRPAARRLPRRPASARSTTRRSTCSRPRRRWQTVTARCCACPSRRPCRWHPAHVWPSGAARRRWQRCACSIRRASCAMRPAAPPPAPTAWACRAAPSASRPGRTAGASRA